MRKSLSRGALAAALFLFGCNGVELVIPDGGDGDAGRPADAGAASDADRPSDGGMIDRGDSGSDLDDSGSMPGLDAGPVEDAGELADAGSVAPDAGSTDPVGLRFVAVGYGGHRTVSLDGRHWDHHVIEDPAGGDDPRLLRGVGYGDGQFIAVGNRVMTSPDGIEWTTRVADTGSFLSDVVWQDGIWVTAGGNGLRMRSTDGGVTFTDPTPFSSGHFRSLAAGNGVFVAVGHTYGGSGLWSTTRDGVTWTDHSGGSVPTHVAFGSGMFVATLEDGRAVSSPDGTAWTDIRLGGSVSWATSVDGGVVLRGGGAYYTSNDEGEWTRHPGSIPESVAGGGEVYVGLTWSDPLLASDTLDGPWTTVDATRPALTDVAVSAP